MPTLPIVTYPKKILKQKAEEVLRITPEIKKLIPQMVETMYASEGIGLAAPQIGISKRIIIVETSDNPRATVRKEKPFDKAQGKPRAFLNPKLIKKYGKSIAEEEGCLSLPGVFVRVKRSEKVQLECQTPEGNTAKIEAGGLIARIFQHEIDHLNGKLIIDYLSPLKKLKFRFK